MSTRRPPTPTTPEASAEAKSKTRPKFKRGGINPWVPNQHGAWAMLILPLLIGFILGLRMSPAPFQSPRTLVLLLSIAATWILGYFMFFAFDLWFKACNPQRKRRYRTPMLIYGSLVAGFGLLTLALRWQMVLWVFFFLPLVTWAFVEVVRRQPRSLSSGISTTLASSLMIPVMVSAATVPLPEFLSFQPLELLAATVAVALYFVGTIPYVKTLIREKGNPAYLKLSFFYHFAALLIVAAFSLWLMAGGRFLVSGGLLIGLFGWCLYRTRKIPALAAQNPRAWTPKRVGVWEMPPTLVLGIACVLCL